MSKKGPAEKIVRDIRRKTRRHHSAKEKIRIVFEGLRGEESIAALCRREDIAESLYYSWSKEFLEAGKKRLAGDTARRATSNEVKRPTTAIDRCCVLHHWRPLEYRSTGRSPHPNAALIALAAAMTSGAICFITSSVKRFEYPATLIAAATSPDPLTIHLAMPFTPTSFSPTSRAYPCARNWASCASRLSISVIVRGVCRGKPHKR